MYADESYYTDTYGGSAVPSDDLTKALTIAADIIDALTYNRIDVLTDLTAFQQTKIQNANCVIAEDVYANGGLTAGGMAIGGFTLGDLTIQSPAGQMVVNGIPVSVRAVSMLRSTGLMYAGLSGYTGVDVL